VPSRAWLARRPGLNPSPSTSELGAVGFLVLLGNPGRLASSKVPAGTHLHPETPLPASHLLSCKPARGPLWPS
jgi:hypothetical protein